MGGGLQVRRKDDPWQPALLPPVIQAVRNIQRWLQNDLSDAGKIVGPFKGGLGTWGW